MPAFSTIHVLSWMHLLCNSVCVCVCVRACVRGCVRACVRVCVVWGCLSPCMCVWGSGMKLCACCINKRPLTVPKINERHFYVICSFPPIGHIVNYPLMNFLTSFSCFFLQTSVATLNYISHKNHWHKIQYKIEVQPQSEQTELPSNHYFLNNPHTVPGILWVSCAGLS